MHMYYRFRRRQWHPTTVLLPGKSHGQRSLEGCSPWGHKESNMTEELGQFCYYSPISISYTLKKKLKDSRIFSAIHCSVFYFVLVS